MYEGRLLLAGGTFLQERQDRLLRHDAVTGVRNHTQLHSADRSEHLDGMLWRDDVVVADDDQSGRLDALQLHAREAWFHGPHAPKTFEDEGPMAHTVRREAGVGVGHRLGLGIEGAHPLEVLGRMPSVRQFAPVTASFVTRSG